MDDMDDTGTGTDTEHGLERLKLFSDGVFAIAITLLVLPLAEATLDSDHVGEGLLALVPRMLTFLLSFAVIGRYWMLHHQLLSGVTRTDAALTTINLSYLFFIAFLPFPTSVLGEHGDTTAATVLYALNLIAIGATAMALRWYPSHGGRLTGSDVTPTQARARLAQATAPTLALIPSVPIAWISTDWAKLSWLLIIPLSLIVNRLFPDDSPPRPTTKPAGGRRGG